MEKYYNTEINSKTLLEKWGPNKTSRIPWKKSTKRNHIWLWFGTSKLVADFRPEYVIVYEYDSKDNYISNSKLQQRFIEDLKKLGVSVTRKEKKDSKKSTVGEKEKHTAWEISDRVLDEIKKVEQEKQEGGVYDLISLFKNWLGMKTDANWGMIETAAICCISTVIDGMVVQRLISNRLYPNVWGLSIGSSTVSRKTTVISNTRRIVSKVSPSLLLPSKSTPQALLYYMSEEGNGKSKGGVFRDEYSSQFKAMNNKLNGNSIKETYDEIFDCPPIVEGELTIARGTCTVRNPYMAQLGGTTKTAIEKYCTIDDILEGFLARFLIYFWEKRERPRKKKTKPNPKEIEAEKKLVMRLKVLYQLLKYHWSRGGPIPITLSKEADMIYNRWDKGIEDEIADNKNDAEAAIKSRLTDYVLKLAAIHYLARNYAYLQGAAIGIELGPPDINYGINMVNKIYLSSALKLCTLLVGDRKVRLANKIYDMIPLDKLIRWSILLTNSNNDADEFKKAIEYLKEAEKIDYGEKETASRGSRKYKQKMIWRIGYETYKKQVEAKKKMLD